MNEPEPAVWTDKGGRVIPVQEMTDDHLRNAIRFVRRRSHSRFVSTSLAILDRMDDEDGSAEDAFMSCVNSMEDPNTGEPVRSRLIDPSRDTPVFADLVAELSRRGLSELPLGPL